MSDPLDKICNESSLSAEVAEALARWERRAGSYVRIQRSATELLDGILEFGSHRAQSSRAEKKVEVQLRNEEIVVWVGQTIKEIEHFQQEHAAAIIDSEKRWLEEVLLSHYNARPSDSPREVAFREAHLLWTVAERTIQNIFDSKEYREARDRACPFSSVPLF